MSNERKTAIAACQECHMICQEMLAYHGDESGGKQLSSGHIKRLMATIEICQVTANLLTIRAPLIDQLCDICAHICEQCATSCRAIDNEAMQRCAEICKRCAQSCYAESSHVKQVA